MVSFAGLAAVVVFSLWGGAIADAFDRRLVLLGSSVLMWLTTLALLVQALLRVDSAWLILVLIAVQAAAFAVSNPTRTAIIPRLMPGEEGASAQTLSWLYSSIAIGSVLGGIPSGWVRRVRRQGVALVVAVIAWGLAVAAAGAVPWLWAVVALLAVGGAADMISAVYRQTMLLTYAPDEMRGRLQGVFFAVVAGGPRLGDLRAGTMAQLTGTTF